MKNHIIQSHIMTQTRSNQFPTRDNTPLSTFDRVQFIFLGLKKNCPKLYEHIKNQRR